MAQNIPHRKCFIEPIQTVRDLGSYLESLRREWISAYDFVLIDSRTGVTDIGVICTVQLPDILVLFFAANEQNLEGAAAIMADAREARKTLPIDRDLLLGLPVPSRIDKWSEIETGRFWKNRISARMAEYYLDWLMPGTSPGEVLDQLIIPYISYWSFGERLPVVEEGTSDKYGLGSAYLLLAELIRNHLDWRVVSQPASEPAPLQYEDKAEAVYQLLSRREKSLAWPLFSRVLVPPSAEMSIDRMNDSELEDLAAKFASAGVLTRSYSLRFEFRDGDIVETWHRLAQWVSDDSEFLSFLRLIRGQANTSRHRYVDDTADTAELSEVALDQVRSFYPSRRMFFTTAERTALRTRLLRAVVPRIEQPAMPEIRDGDTAEAFYLMLPEREQVMVKAVLLSIVQEPVHTSDVASRLENIIPELVSAGLVEVRDYGRIELVEPDLVFLWPRFASWLEEERGLLTTLASVRSKAQLWRRLDRHKSYLLPNDLLVSAEDYLRTKPFLFLQSDVRYIEASRTASSTARVLFDRLSSLLRF